MCEPNIADNEALPCSTWISEQITAEPFSLLLAFGRKSHARASCVQFGWAAFRPKRFSQMDGVISQRIRPGHRRRRQTSQCHKLAILPARPVHTHIQRLIFRVCVCCCTIDPFIPCMLYNFIGLLSPTILLSIPRTSTEISSFCCNFHFPKRIDQK